MKNELIFLGTGAADWSIDCKNENEFFRRNSAALLNRELLIDCGAHIFDYAQSFNLPTLYDGVKSVIISHDHKDHFDKNSLMKIAENKKIFLGCDEYAYNLVCECENICCVPMVLFEHHEINGYDILPLPSNHGTREPLQQTKHYIITTPNGKKIFYGLDGAWFLNHAWHEMQKHKFDIMILDCTVGDKADWRFCEHNTIPMLRILVNGIKEKEILNENGKIIASHFARTLHNSHDETKAILEELGVIAAYDSMTIDF